MGTMTFKTNAKCMGCLAKIEEILQGKMNREEWNCNICFDMCSGNSKMKTKA